MKTTLNIPDDLYREVKAKSALEGRAVREVTVELYTQWLGRRRDAAAAPTADAWLAEWQHMGQQARRGRRTRQTATTILAEDRGRLEPK